MKELTVREMRSALTHLEAVLAAEGELLLKRRGTAIARILPAVSRREPRSHAGLRAAVKPMKRSSAELLREDRDARG